MEPEASEPVAEMSEPSAKSPSAPPAMKPPVSLFGNMENAASPAPAPASASVPESESASDSKPSCWGSTLFKVIVVLSWVVALGLVALWLFCLIKGNAVMTDTDKARGESEAVKSQWRAANDTIKGLDKDIQDRQDEIAKLQKTLQDLQALNITLTGNYTDLQRQNQTVREDIKTVTAQAEALAKENTDLQNSIDHAKGLIQHLHTEIADNQQRIKGLTAEEPVYQLTAAVLGGAFLLVAADDVIARFQLSNVEKAIAQVEPFTRSFHTITLGYENSAAMRWHSGKSVVRNACYETSLGFQSPSLCIDKAPTITTIKTKSGFKFGGVLFAPWPGTNKAQSDNRAFTFSDTHGAVAPINQNEPVAIKGLSGDSFQFGDQDIVVNPPSNTVGQKSFNIPAPYSATTFYVNGTSFEIQKLRIEVLTLA